MNISTYDKFCNAIQNNKIETAEEIFAFSDVRCGLIKNSLKMNDKKVVEQIVSSFISKGLREQALNICEDCILSNCPLKEKIQTQSSISHYTSKENKFKNNKSRAKSVFIRNVFDIDTGYFIKNEEEISLQNYELKTMATVN